MAEQVESKNRATSSEEARKDALEKIKADGVEFLLLWFTDLEGHLKSFAVTPSEIPGALDDGMGFDGSSITGFNAIEESDMVAIPDPGTYRMMPWKEGETKVGRMICDVVTPDGKPYEGDPRYVLRRALDRMQAMGFDTFNIGPELEYFLFKDNKGTETLDEGGYFAMTTLDAASELRQETVRAPRADGDPGRVRPPRGRPVAARDRHPLRAGARDGRPHADLPADRQGDREEGRLPRDLHAEADLRRERLRDAHAPVALHRRSEQLLRRRRPVEPLRGRQGVHRRPATARARDLGRLRPVGELLQAARARLRGAGLRRLVATEPLGPDPDPALQARLRAGDPGGDPLPRPGLQPLPDLRGAAARGARGNRDRATSCPSRWRRTSTT